MLVHPFFKIHSFFKIQPSHLSHQRQAGVLGPNNLPLPGGIPANALNNPRILNAINGVAGLRGLFPGILEDGENGEGDRDDEGNDEEDGENGENNDENNGGNNGGSSGSGGSKGKTEAEKIKEELEEALRKEELLALIMKKTEILEAMHRSNEEDSVSTLESLDDYILGDYNRAASSASSSLSSSLLSGSASASSSSNGVQKSSAENHPLVSILSKPALSESMTNYIIQYVLTKLVERRRLEVEIERSSWLSFHPSGGLSPYMVASKCFERKRRELRERELKEKEEELRELGIFSGGGGVSGTGAKVGTGGKVGLFSFLDYGYGCGWLLGWMEEWGWEE